jgi:hypothetical protein
MSLMISAINIRMPNNDASVLMSASDRVRSKRLRDARDEHRQTPQEADVRLARTSTRIHRLGSDSDACCSAPLGSPITETDTPLPIVELRFG